VIDRNKNVILPVRLDKKMKEDFILKVGKGEASYVIRKFIKAFNKDLVDFK